MTIPQEARSALEKARLALGNGDRRQARQWAERASQLAPNLEDPWLILAAVAGPQQGLEYIRKALQVNPESARAQRGMQWVMQHLRESPPEADHAEAPGTAQSAQRRQTPATPRRAEKQNRRSRGPALAILLLVAGCAILTLAGWTAMTSPVVASMLPRPVLESQPTAAPEWAQVSIAKPTYTATAELPEPATATATATLMPTATASPQVSTASTDLSTDLPTDLPAAT